MFNVAPILSLLGVKASDIDPQLAKQIFDGMCSLPQTLSNLEGELARLRRATEMTTGRGSAERNISDEMLPRNPLEGPWVSHGTLLANETVEFDFGQLLTRWPSAGWLANIGEEELTVQLRYSTSNWEAPEPLMPGTTEAITGYLRGLRVRAGAAGGRYKVRAE